ncbi:MAG: hypothetical protein K6C35_10315 [Eubacterium sp.]|nr:hypothetical protein [Eubacterium sp.]
MKKAKTLIISAMFIIMTFVILFDISSKNTANASSTKQKYYTSISIDDNDTLWTIAERYAAPESGSYNDFIEEVKAINNLCGDRINYGEALVIPQYK